MIDSLIDQQNIFTCLERADYSVEPKGNVQGLVLEVFYRTSIIPKIQEKRLKVMSREQIYIVNLIV